MNFEEVYLQHLDQLNVAVPRYTSYPTANEWKELSSDIYESYIQNMSEKSPISLYVHIPFCHSMCLYCGCAVILNRDPEKEKKYVDSIIQEIEHVARLFGTKRQVCQIHFGGGTPTKLSSQQIATIFEKLQSHFTIVEGAEIAIEIDPRTVLEDRFQKLKDLYAMGFNRISLGVQDTNEEVQEAVKRRQSAEMTSKTFDEARKIGYRHINIDLIYGLPCQTRSSFRDTIDLVGNDLKPDRIALFSYARVPWIKPHQKAIPDRLLPSTEEKFMMCLDAHRSLCNFGYTAIGMDHFAHSSDSLSESVTKGTLRRNFQGYTVLDCSTMIGFGYTAISDIPEGYFQNSKNLDNYYKAIQNGHLPTERGYCTTRDDQLRRDLIHELMCHFKISIPLFEQKWRINFKHYFEKSLKILTWYLKHDFVVLDGEALIITPLGFLFVRNIAACFDQMYLTTESKNRAFSRAV